MRVVLLTAALAALALPAPASATEIHFTGDLTTGPLAGHAFGGTFTFDGALAVPNASDFNGAGLGITAIDLVLAGQHFTRANADAIYLAFDASGAISSFILGGAPSGYDTLDSSDPSADFSLADYGVSYKLAGVGQFIYDGNTLSFETVPEPAAALLLGAGVLGLALRLRRSA